MISAVFYGLWQHHQARIGISLLMLYVVIAAAAPYVTAYHPVDTNLSAVKQPPGLGFLMGTDELGRDIWSRLVFGARISLTVGILSIVISSVFGLGYGVLSGFLGGAADSLLMRIVDGLLSLPAIVLVLALQSLGSPGLLSVILVIASTTWMQTARIARLEFISVKNRPFVQAAVAAGATEANLVLRHILPNIVPPVLVIAAVNVGHAIVTEAALSFLGLGIPPHQPSWGNMLMGGQRSILAGAWWITLFPGLAIITTVLAINLIADGARDLLDHRSRKKR